MQSLEAWAQKVVEGETPAAKLAVTEAPARAAESEGAAPPRPTRTGFTVSSRATRLPRNLESRDARVKVLHALAHHECQAMELMAWAILRFPETPPAFRDGLAAIAADEARHLRLYDERLRALGSAYGELPVRDWFWERVPSCPTPRSFVACLGLGFEGGNLDHSPELIARFEGAGDEESAAVQRLVAREEVAHVAFALRWFRAFGGDDFDSFREALPEPLTPLTMHRLPLARDARRAAGLDDEFLDAYEAWAASVGR